MIDAIVTETGLTTACNEIRRILSENSFIQDLLFDSLRATEPLIKNIPLNYKSLTRNYSISVYHTCNKQIIEEKNGFRIIQAPIFIDCNKKVNQKEYDNIFDELEKFGTSVIGALQDGDENKSLNGKVTEWSYYSQNIWKPDKNDSIKIAEKELYNYILQHIIIIEYSQIISPLY